MSVPDMDVTGTVTGLTLVPNPDGSAVLTIDADGEEGTAGRFEFHLDPRATGALRLAADWVGVE